MSSITIPNIVTISPANAQISATADLPVSSVNNGDGTHTHTYGIPYKGGKSTLAFYGTFTNVTKIEIEAAFDGGQLTDSNATAPATHAGNFIKLTDSADSAIEIDANDIVNLDIGKCMLRFHVVATGAVSPINVAIS